MTTWSDFSSLADMAKRLEDDTRTPAVNAQVAYCGNAAAATSSISYCQESANPLTHETWVWCTCECILTGPRSLAMVALAWIAMAASQ